MNCPACQGAVLDIDVKCSHCGVALAATGAHRMIGSVVLGHYEIEDVVGQGGMSVVLKGRHTITGQAVALKVLPPELATHSQMKSRFLEEAKALAALDHPNIVHLYNFGQENGAFVLAMQFVEGRTWERLILERGRLDWQSSFRIAIDVLKALEYAHGRGVVHRDMKPSNVLVRASDGAATVMDFGIAKMTTSTKLTATGQTMGTVRYMSPEQVRGRDIDERTDIYSLGAALYESVVGDTPFSGSTHFEIMTKHLSEALAPPSARGVALPEVVETAILTCMAKKAHERFESARDARKHLEAALQQADGQPFESQRIQRDLLGVVSTPAGVSPDSRAPAGKRRDDVMGLAETAETPSETLEARPGAALPEVPRARRGGRRWSWLVLGGLVLAAGGGVAALALGRERPAAGSYFGVTLTASERFGDLLIDAVGPVAPERIAMLHREIAAVLRQSYVDAVSQGSDDGPAVMARFDVLQRVVAVPPDRLCPRHLVLAEKERACRPGDGFVVAFAPGGARMLVVTNEPARIEDALRAGIAQAVCAFQPDVSDLTDEQISTLCASIKASGGPPSRPQRRAR